MGLETPILLEPQSHQCCLLLLLNSTAVIPGRCGVACLPINAIHAA